MPNNWSRFIQLFKVLLFFLGKNFSSHPKRLFHLFQTRKANNRATDSLTDPRQCHLTHLPAFLPRQFLHSLHNADSRLHKFIFSSPRFLFSYSCRRLIRLWRTAKIAPLKRRPLDLVSLPTCSPPANVTTYRNNPHPSRIAKPNHLSLLLPIQ